MEQRELLKVRVFTTIGLRQWYGVDPKDGAPLFVADPSICES